MKRSRVAGDQDGRGASPIRRARLAVESLETRALLSTAHPSHLKAAPAKANPFPPYAITLQLGPASDPGGTGYVFENRVLVQGFAVPNSTIWLATQPTGYFTKVARAINTGLYGFLVPVGKGTTEIRAFAESPSQNYSLTSSVTATSSNPIIAWDALALRAIRNLNLADAEASRDLAILHAAQYDAVMAIQSPSLAFQVHASAPRGASAEAAATAAADTVLEALMPSQSEAFQAALKSAKVGLPSNASTRDGLAVGREVAQATLAKRAADGSGVVAYNVPSNQPGLWRPTLPAFSPATDPQWGKVAPFVIASPSAFRPAAPPAVGSPAYDQALAEVASLGRLTSTSRTQDQANAAGFWSDGAFSLTAVGHWNQIAEGIAAGRRGSLAKDARLFAQLDLALADASIATADAKYTYDTWRPISAIETTDPTWVPLVATPSSPGYVSEHAAIGSAASAVLSAEFGPRAKFTDQLYASAGVTRTYASFADAAAEQAIAGVWGGIQTSHDVQAGASLGDQVGKYVTGHFPAAK